ncbi:MAG: HIT domain-containing protein [Chloroflexota bacterium]|nr:HIT domain-containing protein [Chloroflexota bacterium]
MSERLWAPWRLSYIKGEKEEGCIFCNRLARSNDEEDFIVFRGERAFVILNVYPYSNGHLMIVPNEHQDELEAVPDDTLAEMNVLLKRSIIALKKSMSPSGFNVGYNIGRCAGAGILGHVHQHVVPRWDGDTNFMPVIADTSVMPELLAETWKTLRAVF